MSPIPLATALPRLPAGDRALLTALMASAVATLALGVVFGATTGLVRAGLLAADPERGYRALTAHGVTVFFYWLYFGQAALLLAFAATHGLREPRLALAPAAWLGLALMLAGLLANHLGTWLGPPLLYDGSPELVQDHERG